MAKKSITREEYKKILLERIAELIDSENDIIPSIDELELSNEVESLLENNEVLCQIIYNDFLLKGGVDSGDNFLYYAISYILNSNDYELIDQIYLENLSSIKLHELDILEDIIKELE